MTGRRADRFTCGRRARIATSLGERGRGSRLWVGSTEWPRLYGWTRPEQRPGVGDVEPKRGGACRDGGRAEEMTQGAVRRVEARAALAGVGLDVRRGMGARGVEAGVGPRGGPGQQQLEQRAEQPEGARPEGAPGHAGHAGVRTSFRTTTAPSSTIPYMHTISGPVGRSPASDSHSPMIEASAPEPQEMYVRRRISRVKRNAITAGTTRKLNTISTPATGTASVITTPNDR